MKRFAQIALLVLVAGAALGAEVIDRVVAVVRRQVILNSDWEDAVRFEAFLQQRPVESLSVAKRRAVLERLVDQALLLTEMENLKIGFPQNGEVHARVADIRKQVVGDADDAAWNAVLAHYGLEPADVERHVAEQVQLLRFVEFRLRPTVRIERSAIETYYRDEFLPKLRQSGAPEQPLDQVSRKIEQVLIERRVGEMLSTWLQNMRSQTEIQYLLPNENTPATQPDIGAH